MCVFSQIKDMKHIEQKFHSVAWVMPQGRDLGVLVSVGICDGAPLTAHPSIYNYRQTVLETVPLFDKLCCFS